MVYRQGKDATNRWELWSDIIRGPVSYARRISQPMGPSQAVGAFQVRCDGTVLFWADLDTDGVYTPYVTSVTGGSIVEALFVDGFEGGHSHAWD